MACAALPSTHQAVRLSSINFLDPVNKYYVLMAFAALAMWFQSRILNSPFGAVIEAIRENEQRARACGYDVERSKLVFMLSGAICALGGCMSALHLSIVPLDSLHYHTSGMIVMMDAARRRQQLLRALCRRRGLPGDGGRDSRSGRRTGRLFVGAIFVLFVLFLPKGIWGTLSRRVRTMKGAAAIERISCARGIGKVLAASSR